ncbi:FadR/GntR family transcriptional regulator [Reinekea thalattae]|uniref:FadR family transcriptional regulator n=1 Tax=Reinekea thalattae TaxID=2593301 RepID=A0A5C8Z1G1_9GAMM|nr:FadR/GntR family transcriptional regulator [Reinekea thalattae]TXR51357.1 FadR family transcriptional regulator [Reinekea thalattae]
MGGTQYTNLGLERKNLNAQVAREIAVKILSGEIKEGDTLPSEPVLCAMMGVSRTAFREAIKMLYSKGMVESKPKVGTRVCDKTKWNFLDVQLLEWMVNVETTIDIYHQFLELRRAIEPRACALAAEFATDEQLEELSVIFERMVALADDFDHKEWIEVDAQFHRMIFISTDNSFFVPFGNVLATIFKWFFLFSSKEGGVCLEEHQRIYQAIVERKSEEAYNACLSLMLTHKHRLAD